MPTGHSTLHLLDGSDYEMAFADGHKGSGRVLWTDYDYALVYECLHTVGEDGSCPSGEMSVEVLSRDRHLPQEVVEERLVPVLEKNTCVTREDFERVPHDG